MYDSNDYDFKKDDVIETPLQLAKFIYNKVKRKAFKNVLDIGASRGNLTYYFKNRIGLDLIDEHKNNFNSFICKDFLTTTKDDFEDLEIDCIISNPPFSELLSFQFLEHSLKLFPNLAHIFIVPNYILDNSKNRSDDLKKYNITKIVKLDPHIFKDSNVAIHCSIIFINLNFKNNKPYDYFYLEKEIKGKRRTIYLTKEEEEILKDLKVKNFSKFIKELIKEKAKK